MSRAVYICDAVRTPIGRLNGDMLPLSDRLMGKLVDKRLKPVCTPGQATNNAAQD